MTQKNRYPRAKLRHSRSGHQDGWTLTTAMATAPDGSLESLWTSECNASVVLSWIRMPSAVLECFSTVHWRHRGKRTFPSSIFIKMNSCRGDLLTLVGPCKANFELDLSRSELELNGYLMPFNMIIYLFSCNVTGTPHPLETESLPSKLLSILRGVFQPLL